MERVDYESLIIQDILNFHASKGLNITPWYQRRSVWSPPQKAYLINTILERKPVPSIYIRHEIDIENERSIKEVVDGQQRVRTIISYRNDDFAARHPAHKRKVKYSDLTKAEKTQFLSTALSVGYLIGADDRDVIEIFGRINSVSKTLNPQEKRNAQYSGEFKQFCLRQAVDRLPFWRVTNIFSATDISRMQEVQFMSDLVINLIHGLSDYNSTLINNHYRDYDEEFAYEEDVAKRLETLFSKLATLPPEDFSDTIFKASQIAFSLMIVLDRMRGTTVSVDRIRAVVRDIDAKVASYADLKAQSDVQTRLLSGFTGGNLHRIRARKIRDEVLTEAFR